MTQQLAHWQNQQLGLWAPITASLWSRLLSYRSITLTWKQYAWIAGLSGLGLRFLLAGNSLGSNDISTWEFFARTADEYGVIWMYKNVAGWNHPPLTGYLAALLWHVSQWLGLSFSFVFKTLPIAADALSMVLLWKIWSKRSSQKMAALAVLLFACSINAILVSSYHGNTDSLVGALILLACFAIEYCGCAASAGFALALALNIKLIPLMIVPAWFSTIRSRRAFLLLALGLALGTLPFWPVLLTTGSDFYRNAVAYNSNFDHWGFAYLIYLAEHTALLAAPAAWAHSAFMAMGRYVVLIAILTLCGWNRYKKVLTHYELAAMGMALFLFFTPGFGVQYTGILGPLLFAVSLRFAVWYGLSAGVFIGTVYYLFLTPEKPWHSYFTTAFPSPAPELGLAVWASLLAFVLWRCRQAAPHTTM
jgi:Glycosyltransferase family 87